MYTPPLLSVAAAMPTWVVDFHMHWAISPLFVSHLIYFTRFPIGQDLL